MELNKINSLVELFFEKYEEKKELTNQPFLKWLKHQENDFLTWEKVKNNICSLSEYLKKSLSNGDRCVLLSENRPEWLISDIAIMNAGGVTVPLFTTYSENDYEYIINDCNPKICIVSNDIQFKKIEKFISNETKVISIENFDKKIKSISEILKNPKHPYTKGLIAALPDLNNLDAPLKPIPGNIPSPLERPSNCLFRTRCPNPTHECKEGKTSMGLIEVTPGHWVDKCCAKCG